jgi:hypothetical protein
MYLNTWNIYSEMFRNCDSESYAHRHRKGLTKNQLKKIRNSNSQQIVRVTVFLPGLSWEGKQTIFYFWPSYLVIHCWLQFVLYKISLKGLIYYFYHLTILKHLKDLNSMFLNYLILLLNTKRYMSNKILRMEQNSKNESNATILILNTKQDVDFII